jgi:hypothetical protein
MNEAFSEYVLYEPILRILTARGYTVQCEYPCPGLKRNGVGDKKKIDFAVTKPNPPFVIEVRWARDVRLDVERDYEKLNSYLRCTEGSRAFLCVFGRRSHIENIALGNGNFAEVEKLFMRILERLDMVAGCMN